MSMGQIFGLGGLIVGVAMVTVIVGSPNTAGIITASANGFTGALKASMGGK